MRSTEKEDIMDFVLEMQEYVKDGVSIYMDGKSCSPVKAAQNCLLKEEANYMRDYVRDEKDRIVQIRFDRVYSVPPDNAGLY